MFQLSNGEKKYFSGGKNKTNNGVNYFIFLFYIIIIEYKIII
jgi:hypothetical protein